MCNYCLANRMEKIEKGAERTPPSKGTDFFFLVPKMLPLTNYHEGVKRPCPSLDQAVANIEVLAATNGCGHG